MATKKKEAGKYYEGIGRRKAATARVRLTPSSKAEFVINDTQDLKDYFDTEELRVIAQEALNKVAKKKDYAVSARVSGGGIRAQAEAIRLGTARALIKHEESLRGDLKKEGLLKRDARVKERKKFGLKKARRAPQWSKR